MNDSTIYEKLNSYLVTSYANFKEVLDISEQEYNILSRHLFNVLKHDDFYMKLLEEKGLNFSVELLSNLKQFFSNLIENEEEIKKIILTIPELLFFLNNESKIYPIYKSHIFRGVILVYKNEYRSYSYSDKDYNYRKVNSVSQTSTNNFDYVSKTFLQLINRDDFRKDYNINPDDDLETIFNALSEDYNKRDYYIKRH